MKQSKGLWRFWPFWIASLVAGTGANIALAASLMNLYRIGYSSQPILYMMGVEAVIPIATMRILPNILERYSSKTLFVIAAILGAMGALTQALYVNSLPFQFAGIVLTSFAASIQRPLMIQLAARITNDDTERKRINNIITALTYGGVLFGYLLSGSLITFSGYSLCFYINALCYIVFATMTLASDLSDRTPLAVAPDDTAEAQQSVKTVNGSASIGIREILAMTVLLWITGGSINVLEIAFAHESMAANEMQISLLFFASAAGALSFSAYADRITIKETPLMLSAFTIICGAVILAYALVAHIYAALPILYLFGFCAAAQGYLSMTLVQKASAPETLSKNSVLLNTITQATTLTSAAIGVFLASFIAARSAIMIFNVVTIVGGIVIYAFMTRAIRGRSTISMTAGD